MSIDEILVAHEIISTVSPHSYTIPRISEKLGSLFIPRRTRLKYPIGAMSYADDRGATFLLIASLMLPRYYHREVMAFFKALNRVRQVSDTSRGYVILLPDALAHRMAATLRPQGP